VALSFAGAQRPYVDQVASALQAQGVRCFYDADEQIELWGKYLAEELPAIYGEQAAAVVVFVSAEYAARDWTRLERRAALNRAVRERREYVLPARSDDTPLPGLLSDMVAVDLRGRTPQQFAAMISAKLAALGITAPARADSARNQARDAGMARPVGAVRMSEADLRRLGVHAAISVPGAPDEVPPEYVPRDVDAAEFGVRARLAGAIERGGFVLLVGGSSVGKTRCAAEAVRALLPDWWLVHPAAPAEVAVLAAAPPERTVIWLDELQRYLEGEGGLTGGVVRALLNGPHPIVIVGTLWPNRYNTYTAVPAPGAPDPHARERELLDLATVIRIAPNFSPAEQARARVVAAHDRRVAVALGAGGYGVTQTLAAAPQLVARWADARTDDPYAWAVLTAALDVARLGARAPLSPDLLRAAAPGYCTSAQQAEAPDNWFEQALAYATCKLHGTAAALAPAAGASMGQVVGYTVADYLVQHASRERRYERLPASTWDAVLSCIRDPADAVRLADSAEWRLLYRYAIPLYRHAADTGDSYAVSRLIPMLFGRSDWDGLRALADSGNQAAARHLADLAGPGDHGPARRLAERGDLDGLRALADTGNHEAAWRLAELLAERGDLDGLRAWADTGNQAAASRLAELLAGRADLDGLRAWADVGNHEAAWRLDRLLFELGDRNGLHALAEAGNHDAAWREALLGGRVDPDEAVQALRVWTDAVDEYPAWRQAELLFELGDRNGLHALVGTGNQHAAWRQAELLAGRDDLDGLRALVDTGNQAAASCLAHLLAERRDLDGLRALLDTGNLLGALRLAELLAERGDVDGLHALADTGNQYAAWHLAQLLAERGDLDGLRALVDTGNQYAALYLARLLAERGDLDGLRALVDTGNQAAASCLAQLLAERGDVDGLRVLIDTGNEGVAQWLPGLMAEQGRGEEAMRLRQYGLNPDGSIAHA
jgi:hypothetical protein